MLHHDNVSSHSAKLITEFLKQKQIKVIEHSPHSPDAAMCDFWLLFNLKKKKTYVDVTFIQKRLMWS